MRRLPKPSFSVSKVFADCIAGVADPALRGRYESVSAAVNGAEQAFEVRATAQALHTTPQVAVVAGVVSTAEMKDLYEGQMSAARGGGRAYYDAIKNAAPNKKCPLCGVGVVSTLDHHLPKSKYSDLAVSPKNLVPACADCNKAKLAKFPATEAEQTIHPYYDDFTRAQWLHAVLDRGPPLAVRYVAVTPYGWTGIEGSRAARHLDVFKLAALFAANANDELALLKRGLATLYRAGGDPAVQAHLAEVAATHSPRLNSWQHALYATLARDAWFCSGGFEHIPEPG